MCNLEASYSVRALAQAFRREFNPTVPFAVRRKRLKGALGETRLVEDQEGAVVSLLVLLDSRLCPVASEEVLVHELAHVLAFNRAPDSTMTHDVVFADSWASIHRRLFAEEETP